MPRPTKRLARRCPLPPKLRFIHTLWHIKDIRLQHREARKRLPARKEHGAALAAEEAFGGEATARFGIAEDFGGAVDGDGGGGEDEVGGEGAGGFAAVAAMA